MEWKIYISRQAQKQIAKLHNKRLLLSLRLLVDCLKTIGPIPGRQWPNYGKLSGGRAKDRRHCHLISGSPAYVCCWEVIDKKERIIEVYYVGTHEKAPY